MTAFSNATMFDIWASRWCYRCVKDGIGVDGEEPYCPILSAAMFDNSIPDEWAESAPDSIQDYVCAQFEERRDDGGPGDGPQPEPPSAWDAEMPGQTDIFTVYADQIEDAARTASERTEVDA